MLTRTKQRKETSFIKAGRLSRLFKCLEDPDHPSLGPHLRLLGLTGLWAPNPSNLHTRFMRIVFYIAIGFFVSQYVKCIFLSKAGSLTLILRYAPFHMGIIKSCLFKRNYNKWEKIIDYISSVERNQYAMNDLCISKLILDYIGRNRRITYFFWTLVALSNISIFSEPYQKNLTVVNGTGMYHKLFDGYTPFNQEEPPGYYFSMVIQTILGNLLSAYIAGFDTFTFAIVIFFAGQIRITRLLCTRVISKNGDDNETHQNIAECHRNYTTLIRYQDICNSLLSPVLFAYLIVAATNLGICIMQIAKVKNDFATFLSSCIYLQACLVQLLMYFWYGNEVTEASSLLSYGTFESDWVESSLKIKKEMALLQLMTKKRMVFTAGPCNELSLSTFVAILRASHSFYTLLIET